MAGTRAQQGNSNDDLAFSDCTLFMEIRKIFCGAI